MGGVEKASTAVIKFRKLHFPFHVGRVGTRALQMEKRRPQIPG